jgi:hypothetical protein
VTAILPVQIDDIIELSLFPLLMAGLFAGQPNGHRTYARRFVGKFVLVVAMWWPMQLVARMVEPVLASQGIPAPSWTALLTGALVGALCLWGVRWHEPLRTWVDGPREEAAA